MLIGVSVSPHVSQSNVCQYASPHNPTAITAEEYFDPEFQLNERDIGRPVELTSKVQRYRCCCGNRELREP
jgi:hypothetical protein